MSTPDVAETLRLLRLNEVGRRARVRTPFGERLVGYADLTASGRHLHFVEAWIRRVLPYYANTHTEVSSTGRALTELRERAREVVREAVGAGPEHEVIFCGAGATAAVNELVGLLGLTLPEPLQRRYDLARHVPADERPVVFVGPFEHHSNYLPWLESLADVVEVPAVASGAVDLAALERLLDAYRARPLRLGAFSAASNVTGVIADVPAIARTLHAGGALAVFDYAAGGPYLPIDMAPADPAAGIDALFLSPHKFLGGPGSSGVLVAHRDLFASRVPVRPGGGTVDYVGAVDYETVDYVRRLDHREEAGTPAIHGDLRAGVAFLVKRMVGAEVLLAHETALGRRALARLGALPGVRLLGPLEAPRLAIVSLVFEGLHHDFAAGLLDHLFGVQSRSGCACAGPYGHTLLGIERETSERYRALVARGLYGMKPGWVRLSLPYYASEADLEYLFTAVEFVARHGRAFLPCYRFDWETGVWTHTTRDVHAGAPLELSVEALREASQSFAAGDHEMPLSEAEIAEERSRYLREAHAELARVAQAAPTPDANPSSGDAEVDALVWFDWVHATPLPGASDAAAR